MYRTNQISFLIALTALMLPLPLAAQAFRAQLEAEDIAASADANNSSVQPNINNSSFNPTYNPQINLSISGGASSGLNVVHSEYIPPYNSRAAFAVGGETLNPFAPDGLQFQGRQRKPSSTATAASTWTSLPRPPAWLQKAETSQPSESPFENLGRQAHSDTGVQPNFGAKSNLAGPNNSGAPRSPGNSLPARSKELATASSVSPQSPGQPSIAQMSSPQNLGGLPVESTQHNGGSGGALARMSASVFLKSPGHSASVNSASQSSRYTNSANRLSERMSFVSGDTERTTASRGLLHAAPAKENSGHAHSVSVFSNSGTSTVAGSRQTSASNNGAVLLESKKKCLFSNSSSGSR